MFPVRARAWDIFSSLGGKEKEMFCQPGQPMGKDYEIFHELGRKKESRVELGK